MQSIGDMRAIVSVSLLVLLATAVGAEVQVIRPPKAVALLWTTLAPSGSAHAPRRMAHVP